MTKRIGKGSGDLLPLFANNLLLLSANKMNLAGEPLKKQGGRDYSMSPRLPCI